MHRPTATVPTAATEEHTTLPTSSTPTSSSATTPAAVTSDDRAFLFISPSEALTSSGQRQQQHHLMVPYTPLESPPPTPYTSATQQAPSTSKVRSNLQLDAISPLNAPSARGGGGAPPQPLTDSPEDAAVTSSHRANGAVKPPSKGGTVTIGSKQGDVVSPLTMERERVARVQKEVTRLSGQHHSVSQSPLLPLKTTPEDEKVEIVSAVSPAAAAAGGNKSTAPSATTANVRASGQHGIASALHTFSTMSPNSEHQPATFRPKTQWSPLQSRSPSAKAAAESRQERAQAYASRRRAEDEANEKAAAAAEAARRDAAASHAEDYACELAGAAAAGAAALPAVAPVQLSAPSGSGKKSPVEEVAERAAAGVAAAKQRAAEREARAAAVASAMQMASELEESAWATAEGLVSDPTSGSARTAAVPLHWSPPLPQRASSFVDSSSRFAESISPATTVTVTSPTVFIYDGTVHQDSSGGAIGSGVLEGSSHSNDASSSIDSPTSTNRSDSSASPEPLDSEDTAQRHTHPRTTGSGDNNSISSTPHSVAFDVSLFDWSLGSFGVPQRIVFTRATSKALGVSRRQVR